MMVSDDTRHHWIETLLSAFDCGFSDPLNVEWLIDRAEAGEWSGLWW